MPHRRLKEAAPFAVLHPAGNYVGKPEACWEAWSLCMVSCAVKDIRHTVLCRRREKGRLNIFKMWHSLFFSSHFLILLIYLFFSAFSLAFSFLQRLCDAIFHRAILHMLMLTFEISVTKIQLTYMYKC